jgi:hypothetical protein
MNNVMDMKNRSSELVARRRDLSGFGAAGSNEFEFTAQDNARILASINRERHPAAAIISALKHVLLILTVLYVIFFLVAVIKANAKSDYTSKNYGDNYSTAYKDFNGHQGFNGQSV